MNFLSLPQDNDFIFGVGVVDKEKLTLPTLNEQQHLHVDLHKLARGAIMTQRNKASVMREEMPT